MIYKFSYFKDFPNKDKIELLEQACKNFFKDESKKIGINKEGSKCIRGFYIHLYSTGEINFAPVILYSEKLIHEIDFKMLGINKKEHEQYEQDFYNQDDVFNNLEKFCYVLHDGKKYHEFMVDLSQNINREELVQKLNTIFFINPFKANLEKSLEEKPNKVKIKI